MGLPMRHLHDMALGSERTTGQISEWSGHVCVNCVMCEVWGVKSEV